MRAGQYIVMGNRKVVDRLANRKVHGNVIKEAIVPETPSFPVAFGHLKPKTIQESEKDAEELGYDNAEGL